MEAVEPIKRNRSWQEPEPKLRKRKGMPDIWEARYRRYAADGTEEQPREAFGDVKQFPDKTALKSSHHWQQFIKRINNVREAVLFRDLCHAYDNEHIEKMDRVKNRSTYRRNMAYLEDKWGKLSLSELLKSGLKIKQWLEGDLRSHKYPEEQLAFQTREHIRALLSQMLNFAVLRGDIEHNPFDKVRMLTKGGARPVDRSEFEITPETFRWMQADPKTRGHVKMMQFIAYCMGLRMEEFLALMWDDIDFDGLEPRIHIQRTVVGKHIQRVKTPASQAKLPMCDLMGAALLCFGDDYPPIAGWVFGSIRTNRPFHGGILGAKNLRSAMHRMAAAFQKEPDGVPPGTGFHAFRHNYRKLMDELNSPIEVQQRLMRHADRAMTEHYGRSSWVMKRRLREVHTSVTGLATGVI